MIYYTKTSILSYLLYPFVVVQDLVYHGLSVWSMTVSTMIWAQGLLLLQQPSYNCFQVNGLGPESAK